MSLLSNFFIEWKKRQRDGNVFVAFEERLDNIPFTILLFGKGSQDAET
jgi:hypothetical protein